MLLQYCIITRYVCSQSLFFSTRLHSGLSDPMKQHCKISQQPLISESELISRWLQLTPLLTAFRINTSQVQKVSWGLTQNPGPDIVIKARWWWHKYFKIWLTLSLPKAMSKLGVAGRRIEDFNEKVWTCGDSPCFQLKNFLATHPSWAFRNWEITLDGPWLCDGTQFCLFHNSLCCFWVGFCAYFPRCHLDKSAHVICKANKGRESGSREEKRSV